jgi:hypothetical protein
MKTHPPIIRPAILWLATALLASATPDHEVRFEEQLLGSNADGYITLKTEHDNLGSYYSSRTKRFLVEYSKAPQDPKIGESLGAELRRDLLLDVTTRVDADPAPGTVPTKSVKVNSRNETVLLADILLRFPATPEPWDKDKFAKLSSHPTAGVRMGEVPIAWGGWIKERFGADRNAELEWTVSEVREDGNGLFLIVRSDSRGQRIVSIPDRKTRQVRDHLAKQPIYLIAGKFKTLDEALARARELIQTTQGKFEPEVWSAGSSTEQLDFVVADSKSRDHLRGGGFEAFEKETGTDLSAMSSERFIERTEISPLIPDPKVKDN